MTNKETNMRISILRELWLHLSSRRQKQFVLLLFLMIIASIAEIVSLGAVLPFLGILTAPDQVYQNDYMQPFIQLLNITSSDQLILPLTIVFIVLVVFASVVRILLLYIMTRFSYAAGADLSISIYSRTLYQKYQVHLMRNSGEIINSIIFKTNTVIGGVILPVLIFISAIFLLIGVMSALLLINVELMLSTIFTFGLFYWIVIKYTKNKIKENSRIIAEQSTLLVKTLQEGLGGIRDILIDGSQNFYCKIYRKSDLPLRRASGNNKFMSGSPRYIMEAIGMSVIATLAYVASQQQGGISAVIPILGAIALGAQRLLPAMQQAYGAYSQIQGSRSSLQDVLILLDQKIPKSNKISPSTLLLFKKNIELKNLSFRYSKESPWVLKNINLSLEKGTKIGFVGETGVGKSTLIDIVMGLVTPTNGSLCVDGEQINEQNLRAWQLNIAHVPQNIYLSDGAIEENIAFGLNKDEIDRKQVELAAKRAQISELINRWMDGYSSVVGERGVRLSGGQRQRVGIARALYKNANVLIFDEATSALDEKTEEKVMKAIENLQERTTVLIIAHRLTTLKTCDKIVKLDKNQGLSICTYDEIVNSKIIE